MFHRQTLSSVSITGFLLLLFRSTSSVIQQQMKVLFFCRLSYKADLKLPYFKCVLLLKTAVHKGAHYLSALGVGVWLTVWESVSGSILTPIYPGQRHQSVLSGPRGRAWPRRARLCERQKWLLLCVCVLMEEEDDEDVDWRLNAGERLSHQNTQWMQSRCLWKWIKVWIQVIRLWSLSLIHWDYLEMLNQRSTNRSSQWPYGGVSDRQLEGCVFKSMVSKSLDTPVKIVFNLFLQHFNHKVWNHFKL